MSEKIEKILENIEKEINEDLKEFESLQTLTFEDLKKIDIKSLDWIVENLIPEKSVVLLAGKRASFKTWLVLHLIDCICNQKNFLEKFPTKKVGILLIDEENGPIILRERIEKLISRDANLPNFYLTSFEGIKLDKHEWLSKLQKFLVEHPEVKLIIIDSFRRVSGIDENQAEDVSWFLTNVIRPLTLNFGVSVILIHHMRKGLGKNPVDEMDEIRGSSDLANYSDTILILERPKGSNDQIILRHVKSRRSIELEPILIEIEWNAEDGIRFIAKGTAIEILNDVEKCRAQILCWIEENGITSFKTKEITEAMKSYKFSPKTTQRALAELLTLGKLTKVRRGIFTKPGEKLNSFIGQMDKKDSVHSVHKSKFRKLEEPSEGMCAYCGEKTTREYIDMDGNFLCKRCYECESGEMDKMD